MSRVLRGALKIPVADNRKQSSLSARIIYRREIPNQRPSRISRPIQRCPQLDSLVYTVRGYNYRLTIKNDAEQFALLLDALGCSA